MKAGWAAKPLGNVCTLQRGFDLPTQQRIQGIYPLVSSSGVIDTHNEAPVKAPGVVTGRSGSVGNVFFIERDFWPLNTTLYVRDFHGNDPRFVYHLLSQFDLKRFAGGTGVPTLNRNDVHGVPVFVPDNIEEQQRIVALLDEAFAGIATARAAAEQNRQNARALFESHLQSVFSLRGEGWVEKSLEELGTITSSKRIFKSEYVESGVPFYRTKEIKELANGREITTELFISEARYREIKEGFGVPKTGDVLLTAIGTIGETWVVEGNDDFYFKDGNVLWLKEFTSITPRFLKYVLQSFVESLNKMSHGSAYSALPIQRLNAHKIFLPSQAEQEQIVTTLDALYDETQRLEAFYQRKLAALDELKQSLLHQAFSGQL